MSAAELRQRQGSPDPLPAHSFPMMVLCTIVLSLGTAQSKNYHVMLLLVSMLSYYDLCYPAICYYSEENYNMVQRSMKISAPA